MQYKRFFRPQYLARQSGASANLRRLSKRLHGSWQPSPPHPVFLPKPSGLQRPLSFLEIEDQIVLQAVANAFAQKLWTRRKAVEFKASYSNILNEQQQSIFFVRDWRKTYHGFQIRSYRNWFSGLQWVAHFDLAAFYDTISHELLFRVVSPRGGNAETWAKVREWFKCWSSPHDGHGFDHGIPQGPVASDFLAECFLLPMDEALLGEGINYVRYVDDIRIFGRTELEVRRAAVRLERLCRLYGLIPQGEKFAIKEARSIDDVMELIPSLAPPNQGYGSQTLDDPQAAEERFRSALGGRPLGIDDKSSARFVLFSGPPSRKILGWVVKLLEHYPEHIDAFVAYASNFTSSKPFCDVAADILRGGLPYEYVRGELWHVLARMGGREHVRRMRSLALEELRTAQGISLRWGLLAFLLRAERDGLGRIAWRVRYETPLVQAWLVPILPAYEYESDRLVPKLLRDGNVESGIAIAEELVTRNLKLRDLKVRVSELNAYVQNTFRDLSLIQRRRVMRVDQIGELLTRRLSMESPMRWRTLLGGEYSHALSILAKAEALFDSGRTQWLMHQNSFSDLVLRAFIRFLNDRGLPGARSLVGRDQRLIKFGVLLESNGPFARAYPQVADALRLINDRRNSVPGAHPYDEKGGAQNAFLGRGEQRRFVRKLRDAYSAIMTAVDGVA